MGRKIAIVAVATLVLFSGCAGLNGTDSPTDTGTDAPTETTVELEELGSASELTDSTMNTLNNQSYQLTIDAASQTESTSSEQISVRKGDTGMYFELQGGDGQVQEAWAPSNSNIAAIKQGTGDDAQYSVINGEAYNQLVGSIGQTTLNAAVPMYVDAFNYTNVDSTEVDGMTVYTFESTGVNESNSDSNIEDGDMTLTVREDGTVLGFEGDVTLVSDNGETETQDVMMSLSNIGETTVEEPMWYSEEVPKLSGEFTNDGRVLELSHNGGPAVTEEEQAIVNLGFASEQLGGLNEGETVYVTATQSDGEVNISIAETEPTVGDDSINLSQRGIGVSTMSDGLSMRLTFGESQLE